MLAFILFFTFLFLMFYFMPFALYIVLGFGLLALIIGTLGCLFNIADKTLGCIKEKVLK